MIGRAASSSSFAKTIKYVLAEAKKSKIVFGNFAEAVGKTSNVDSVIYRMNQRSVLNSRVQKPCYHLKFSPAIEDAHLTEGDWAELISKLLKDLELETNQAIGVLHQDTYYPNSNKVRKHLHLVVSKLDHQLHSRSSNLYYDYYKIEQILRSFGIEKNLTRVDFNHRPVDNIYKTTKKMEEKDQPHKIPLGDFLRDLDQTTESLETKEDQLNGLDLASYGITTALSVAKVALALMNKAENAEDREKLEEIVVTADKIPVTELIDEDQKLLVEKLRDEITSAEIPEFASQAQKFLKAQVNAIELATTRKQKETLANSNSIFERVKNYLHSVDSLIETDTAQEYTIDSNSNPQYTLIDRDANKLISVSIGGRELYRAQTLENGRWQVQIDHLSDRNKEVIARLPQTKEEAYREYAGRKLAPYLARHMSANNVEQFSWCSAVENGQKILHQVRISAKTKKGIELIAKDQSNREVFRSKITNDNQVVVVQNKISLSHLELFIKRYEHEQKNSTTRQKNETNNHNSKLKR